MDTTVLFEEPEELDFTGSVWSTADGGFVTSSLKVAEYFGKNHQHILEAIREKRSVENSTHLWFYDSTYKDNYDREQKQVLMNQSGFMYLAMGFTGAKADQIKIGYINEFERMRATIQNQLPDFTNPDYVRSALVALDTLMAQNKQLKDELQVAKPLAEVGMTFSETEGGMTMSNVAKQCGVKGITRDYLLAILVEEDMAKKEPFGYTKYYGSKHSKDFIDKRLYQKVKSTPAGNKSYLKTTVFGYGWLVALAKEYQANGFEIEKRKVRKRKKSNDFIW